jgi:hypothetical protein
MPIGTRVYHSVLKMNLIVCQVNAKGRIICINPQIYSDDKYQVLTVDASYLTKGWKVLYD